MKIQDFYPEFEVIRNDSRCTRCRLCERQCANGVHSFDESRRLMLADESRCVNCQRCVLVCPVRALKIVKSDCAPRENARPPPAACSSPPWAIPNLSPSIGIGF